MLPIVTPSNQSKKDLSFWATTPWRTSVGQCFLIGSVRYLPDAPPS